VIDLTMVDEPIDLTMEDQPIDLTMDDEQIDQPAPTPMEIDDDDDFPQLPPDPFVFPRQLLFYPPEYEEVLVVSVGVLRTCSLLTLFIGACSCCSQRLIGTNGGGRILGFADALHSRILNILSDFLLIPRSVE
jgi:hypothetical protein